MEHLRDNADEDRHGGLERSVEAARHRNQPQPRPWLLVAQAFAGQQDFERAVEFYELAIFPAQTRLSTDLATRAADLARAHRRAIEFYLLALRDRRYDLRLEELAMAQLNYGIALFKLNRLDEARATWETIQGDAAGILARAWLDIAAQ